jgi:mRNA interferase HigB
VNVVSRPTLLAAARKHPQCATWLDTWWRIAKTRQWNNHLDVVSDFGSADHVGCCLIFNCGGYRLICAVVWATEKFNGKLYIKAFLTHDEYDRGGWKEDCRC